MFFRIIKGPMSQKSHHEWKNRETHGTGEDGGEDGEPGMQMGTESRAVGRLGRRERGSNRGSL
jgi:hypothetical protein